MCFSEWQKERFIRKTLKRISRQRVAAILQPGNVWLVEKSPHIDEKMEAALRTCHLRGWVEPLADAVPKGEVTKKGDLPDRPYGVGPIYRLTEAGWNALNRIYGWVIATWLIAFVTLITTMISIIMSRG